MSVRARNKKNIFEYIYAKLLSVLAISQNPYGINRKKDLFKSDFLIHFTKKIVNLVLQESTVDYKNMIQGWLQLQGFDQ